MAAEVCSTDDRAAGRLAFVRCGRPQMPWFTNRSSGGIRPPKDSRAWLASRCLPMKCGCGDITALVQRVCAHKVALAKAIGHIQNLEDADC